MPEIVVVDRLVKRYGSRLAVRGVSFAIEEGEIIGLLGPNGSGKSTILRMLAGYLPPTAGTVRVAGIDVAVGLGGGAPNRSAMSLRTRRSTTACGSASSCGSWPQSRAWPAARRRAAVDAAVERLDLGPVLRMPIGKISRGYRQRVAIAQALVNDPPLLILDEPTNALDAYQVIGVRELVRSMAGRRTVVFASHVLAEIERVATRVMILRDGGLLTSDALHEVRPAPQVRLLRRRPAAGCSGRVVAGSGRRRRDALERRTRIGRHGAQLSGRDRAGPAARRPISPAPSSPRVMRSMSSSR